MSKTIDMNRIGLKPREMQVLRAARWAWDQVPNGHYLCSSGQNRAAERMIERGFLTKADAQFSPPAPSWLVVVITDENYAALNAASSVSSTGRDTPTASSPAGSTPAQRLPE